MSKKYRIYKEETLYGREWYHVYSNNWLLKILGLGYMTTFGNLEHAKTYIENKGNFPKITEIEY